MTTPKKLLMGNEAIALGAIRAGVNLVCGYPGTPSTEILETVAKNNDGSIYVEWSVNEKAAMEIAAGAAYSGARTLVTMKQVGLNVASDPLMSLAYLNIEGGMVIVSADDPGPISSQTEQDTRHFAEFSKLPVFDPTSPEEAYYMMESAFELSEKYHTPVLFRPTTRLCHGCASIALQSDIKKHTPKGFVKDTMRYVIFPRTSYLNHIKIEERNRELSDVFSQSRYNEISGNTSAKLGIATGGVSYEYTKEVIPNELKLFKVGTPHPFPKKLALEFLQGLDEVLCEEELDPVIEKNLIMLAGEHHLNVKIKGKLSGNSKNAGENTTESISADIAAFMGKPAESAAAKPAPDLPVRPPVLCAGCPHRASFYAVKQAAKGTKSVFCGDIGCYTLGNAMPLDMVDTCLCMGADITIAQGIRRINPDSTVFSFIGDSTFFAAGMTGIVNAVYNQTDIILIVLDNSTTAMTGHQPHPGTGVTMMGDIVNKVSIEKILKAVGVESVDTVNPLDQTAAISAVKNAMAQNGVRAVIFKSPCIAVSKPMPAYKIDSDKCKGCKMCVNELGCPAISYQNGKPCIEPSLCYGCGLCSSVCKFGAIEKS